MCNADPGHAVQPVLEQARLPMSLTRSLCLWMCTAGQAGGGVDWLRVSLHRVVSNAPWQRGNISCDLSVRTSALQRGGQCRAARLVPVLRVHALTPPRAASLQQQTPPRPPPPPLMLHARTGRRGTQAHRSIGETEALADASAHASKLNASRGSDPPLNRPLGKSFCSAVCVMRIPACSNSCT